MKKVLVFTGFFLPHKGGVENYIFEVYRRLNQIATTIITVNTNHAPTIETIAGLKIIRLPGWNLIGESYPIPRPSLLTLRLLLGLWREHYDVVNTHTRFFITSIMGLGFAKIKRLPLLHTEHGSNYVRHESKIVELIAFLVDQTFGKLMFRQAEKVVAVSKAAATFVERMGARQRVGVVYNGVDTSFFRRQKTNLKRKLKIPRNAVVVSFVGRLMKVKGPDLLIKAFKRIQVKAYLLVIGTGPLRDRLLKLKSGSSRILLLGAKERATIPKFLSITDIFVLPSNHPEGLPTSLLEAGACQCAVISTNIGGVPELIQHRINGLLMPSNKQRFIIETLQTLLDKPKLRERFGQALRHDIIEHFDWRVLAPEYLKLLQATYHGYKQ